MKLWQRILDGIKSLLVVTAITGLIWLYAEGENIKPHTLAFDVQFVSPPDRQLVIKPAEPQRVRMVFRCATGVFTEVQRQASTPIRLVVNDDPTREVTTQTVVLRDWLMTRSELGKLGVNIDLDAAQQATMDVQVERIEPVDMRVALGAPGAPGAAAVVPTATTIKPTTAQVRVNASRAKEAAAQSLLATPDPQTFIKLEPNVPHTLTVPLIAPAGLRDYVTSITPKTVEVTFTVRRQSEALTLTVPLELNLPPQETRRVEVVVDEDVRLLRDIKLEGPSDVIERIKKDPSQVLALLRLSAEDIDKALGKENATAPVRLIVPPGVVVASPVPPVTFRVSLRGTSVTPGR